MENEVDYSSMPVKDIIHAVPHYKVDFEGHDGIKFTNLCPEGSRIIWNGVAGKLVMVPNAGFLYVNADKPWKAGYAVRPIRNKLERLNAKSESVAYILKARIQDKNKDGVIDHSGEMFPDENLNGKLDLGEVERYSTGMGEIGEVPYNIPVFETVAHIRYMPGEDIETKVQVETELFKPYPAFPRTELVAFGSNGEVIDTEKVLRLEDVHDLRVIHKMREDSLETIVHCPINPTRLPERLKIGVQLELKGRCLLRSVYTNARTGEKVAETYAYLVKQDARGISPEMGTIGSAPLKKEAEEEAEMEAIEALPDTSVADY